MEPLKKDEFIEYLVQRESWVEAVKQLVDVVNDENYVSKHKTKQQFWIQLCDIISQHSDKLFNEIPLEPILRGGMKKFNNDIGKLWTSLADIYIRSGMFDKARDIFEEGMNTVVTVKDFTQIWDAYAKFEDSFIALQMQALENGEEEDDEGDEKRSMVEFDLRVARYEYLIDRQPLLVNSVLLRQNPHNVHEWRKRANLFKQDPRMAVETYTTALTTIDPQKAKGKPHLLWIDFAKFYESHGDIKSARKIFEKAVQSNFKFTDDLATIWCEYGEMELRNGNYEAARSVLQRAVTPVTTTVASGDENDPNVEEPSTINKEKSVQRKVYKSTKLWAFYVDLEESFGTFKSTQAAYERMIELKSCTPQTIINYATFLEENKAFEESFKAFEKGISLFNFPHVFDIWICYLTKFIARYGGRKLERARELFEQVCKSAPPSYSKVFYIMYADLEEEFGLARHVISVYDRATRAVEEKDRFAMYSLYISKVTEFFGITRTREIYEKAIQVLPERLAVKMCLRYCELEIKLGEIDRARAILVHGSQLANPQFEADFWNRWREFEVEFGNQDTFREMLRIKRTVQAQFNTSINYMSAEIMAKKQLENTSTLQTMVPASSTQAPSSASVDDVMAKLEQQAARYSNEKAKQQASTSGEIALSDDEEEEEEEDRTKRKQKEDNMEIEEMQVPREVFEKNINSNSNDNSGSKLGALARLKRKHSETTN